MKHYIYILTALLLIGCGTRKKALEKQNEKTKTETRQVVDSVARNDKTDKKETQVIKISRSKDVSDDFEGIVSDSTKPATVSRETRENVVIETFTNFKTVKRRNETKEAQDTARVTARVTARDQSVIKLQKETDNKEQSKVKSKKSDVETKKPMAWIPITVGIVTLILGGLLFLYVKGLTK